MKRIVTGLVAFAVAAGATAPAFADRDWRRGDRDWRRDRWEERHEWRRGDRWDRGFYYRTRAIDWRYYRLPRPHAGCEWREYNGRFFEVVIATGLLLSIFDHGRY